MIHSIDSSDDEVEHVESGPTPEDVEKMGAATRAFFVFMAAAVAFFESRQDAQGSEEFEIGRSMAKLRIARKREAELLLDATPKPNKPFNPVNAANYSKAMEENRLEMVRINIGLNASFLSIRGIQRLGREYLKSREARLAHQLEEEQAASTLAPDADQVTSSALELGASSGVGSSGASSGAVRMFD